MFYKVLEIVCFCIGYAILLYIILRAFEFFYVKAMGPIFEAEAEAEEEARKKLLEDIEKILKSNIK